MTPQPTPNATIAVDLVLATRPKASTGIERYALNLFEALGSIAPGTIGFVDDASSLPQAPNLIRVKGGFKGWLSLPTTAAFRQHKIGTLLCPAFPPSPLVVASKLPVARIIHDDFPWTRGHAMNLRGRMLFRHFEGLAAPRYASIFAPTDLMAQSLTQILRRDVGTIGNAPGIDLSKAPPQATRKPQVVAVGTIEPRKNYEALVAAQRHLPPDWSVAVVGRNGWGPIAEAWDGHVAAAQGRLAWHGHASDETLLGLYRESSCFVSMSLAEGFNMPLVEAGSLGLPVVCSDIEIHRSVAPPWARFVPLSIAPEELARIVTETAQTPPDAAAVETYRNTFSWGSIARNIKNRIAP